jgi:hypothetical protein
MRAASLSDPQTLNMYAYCGNDPINRVDPSGLFFGFIIAAIAAIGAAIVAVARKVARHVISSIKARISSGPGFRTPPIFPGNLPGFNRNLPSPLFRTPPFVQSTALTYAEQLKNYLKVGFDRDCIEAVGGQQKVNDWIKAIDDGKVTFHRWNSSAEIKDSSGIFNPNGRTVAEYWDYAKSKLPKSIYNQRPSGVTIISSINPYTWDAHRWNKIIIGPTSKGDVTLLHEFLHWETNGNHTTITDARHLDLEARGYDVSTDEKAKDAINEFFDSNCRNK